MNTGDYPAVAHSIKKSDNQSLGELKTYTELAVLGFPYFRKKKNRNRVPAGV
jgi:hypothetical protein